MSRKMEVLAAIRSFAGDNRHFSRPFGTLEVARRISIFHQAIAYCKSKGLTHNKLDKVLELELRRHPDLRDYMVRFGELTEAEFNHTLAAGDFVDGDGQTYVNWCLKSIGLRLNEVLDEV